jgi:hypothetical protein
MYSLQGFGSCHPSFLQRHYFEPLQRILDIRPPHKLLQKRFWITVSLNNRSISWFRLTCTVLIDLFCRDGENTKNFDHDFHDYVHHSGGSRDFDIDLQSSEDVFYALEEAKEEISASTDSISGLKG